MAERAAEISVARESNRVPAISSHLRPEFSTTDVKEILAHRMHPRKVKVP